MWSVIVTVEQGRKEVAEMNKVVGIFVINLHSPGDFAFAEDLEFVARRVGENVNLVWLLRRKNRINTEKIYFHTPATYIGVNDINLSETQQIVVVQDFVLKSVEGLSPEAD